MARCGAGLVVADTAARAAREVWRGAVFLMGALTLCLWWRQSFLGLTEQKGGGREADDFRAVSRFTAAQQERYPPRPNLFNLSDRMELAAGTLSALGSPWGGSGELQN